MNGKELALLRDLKYFLDQHGVKLDLTEYWPGDGLEPFCESGLTGDGIDITFDQETAKVLAEDTK